MNENVKNTPYLAILKKVKKKIPFLRLKPHQNVCIILWVNQLTNQSTTGHGENIVSLAEVMTPGCQPDSITSQPSFSWQIFCPAADKIAY